MKKILVIAPYPYLPFFSGGQKLIAKFLDYLSKEAQVTVIGSETNDWSLAPGYTCLPWLKPSFSRYYDTGLVNKITALVKSENLQVLICEHPYMAWLAFRIRKRTGIKVIIHTHNIEYQRFRSMGKWWWPILKWYEKRSFKKADGILFITPEDKYFAVQKWGIPEEKCTEVPFGIDINSYPLDRAASKKEIADRHGFAETDTILSFNGLLDYKPNLDALKIILDVINPLLLQQGSFRYKIIINGKQLPEEMNGLKEYADRNVIYTGFVEDIVSYLKATDIFLNPVQGGGGIKTKMVEAIGFGATVIATEKAATGIEREVCGKKLIILPDNDWSSFSQKIIDSSNQSVVTPDAYYKVYYWGAILRHVLLKLKFELPA